MTVVKSFSLGTGDMFYICHASDNFSIIDCQLSQDDREWIVAEIKNQSSSKGVIRFISTHPDDDHIRGLEYLDDEIGIKNFYCVKNEATKESETDDFQRYCELRDSTKAFFLYAGCKRLWMNQSNDDRGSAGINILWPNPENNDFKDALKTANDGEFRLGQQFLRMMQASDLDEWKRALSMRAKPSSNFTYADRNGNITLLEEVEC